MFLILFGNILNSVIIKVEYAFYYNSGIENKIKMIFEIILSIYIDFCYLIKKYLIFNKILYI